MTFAQFIVLLTALGGVALAVIRMVRPYVKDARLAKVLEIAERLVGAAVANAEQTRVRELKDPALPGQWNAVSAGKVKENVIIDVKNTAPLLTQKMDELGITFPTALLGQLVEKQVTAQKAANALPLSVSVLSVPPPSAHTEGTTS